MCVTARPSQDELLSSIALVASAHCALQEGQQTNCYGIRMQVVTMIALFHAIESTTTYNRDEIIFTVEQQLGRGVLGMLCADGGATARLNSIASILQQVRSTIVKEQRATIHNLI